MTWPMLLMLDSRPVGGSRRGVVHNVCSRRVGASIVLVNAYYFILVRYTTRCMNRKR